MIMKVHTILASVFTKKSEPKPKPIITFISPQLVKITVYRKNIFGVHENVIYWNKMYDTYTGQYIFFNDKESRIINCEAQEAIEKCIDPADNKIKIK